VHSRQVSAHATALEAELTERRQAFAALTAECAAARTGLAQARENVQQTEQRAVALETETVRLRDDLQQREQTIARLEQAGRETTTKVRVLDEALGALRLQSTVAGERLHTQEEAMRKLEHDLNSTQQELRQLHDRLEAAARRAENLRSSLESAEKELADLRRRPLVRLDAALRRAKSKPAAPATQA
jgi:chromosome segregation ATPase